MKQQRSMISRIIVLLIAFGLVGGYVAYRVWAEAKRSAPIDPPIQFSGSKSGPVVPAPSSPAQQESHFVGSKSARVFEPPVQPTPPETKGSESENLGPVGPKP